jgi:DNA polymerase (family 10)
MKKIKNSEIARIFRDIADLLDLKNDNPFRVRAYRKASQLIENLPEQLYDIASDEERSLTDLQGIGKDLAGKMTELFETGKLNFLDKLKKEVPITLTEVMQLEGVGPKKAAAVFRELGVETVDQLEEAVAAGRIEELDGFGLKTAQKILRSIESFRRRLGRFKYTEAEEYADDLILYLKEMKDVLDISPAGSYRRSRETIGDIDILVAAEDGSDIMNHFIKYDSVDDIIARGSTKSSVRLMNGIQVDLRVLPPDSFGAGMQYFSGSQAHNVALRSLAKKKDLKLSEYGVFSGEKKIAGKTEEEVYARLGLPLIPPELRENRGEVEAALGPGLPDLLVLDDIRGDLQMHTFASDGHNSIEEMALASMELGYEYIAITDHSQAETQAGGLKENEVLKHLEAIDAADKKIKGIKILKGMEVDILKDGSLDYPDSILEKLDIVMVSIHSHFRISRDEQTKRIVRALEHPLVQVFAHPTGRLIQQRDPYDFDMRAAMEVSKEKGVALELNAYPDRLDLNDEHCRLAKELGIMIIISTDAHSTRQLDVMRYGIATARRGWLEKSDVLNTMPLSDFLKAIKK